MKSPATCASRADALLCSGYKPNIVGSYAARRVGIPAIARCGGWTSVTWKVRLNETLDRLMLHRMDAVVCVSADLARQVRRWLVPKHRVSVIYNGISSDELPVSIALRGETCAFISRCTTVLIGTASRLSREKGLMDLVAAAKSSYVPGELAS